MYTRKQLHSKVYSYLISKSDAYRLVDEEIVTSLIDLWDKKQYVQLIELLKERLAENTVRFSNNPYRWSCFGAQIDYEYYNRTKHIKVFDLLAITQLEMVYKEAKKRPHEWFDAWADISPKIAFTIFNEELIPHLSESNDSFEDHVHTYCLKVIPLISDNFGDKYIGNIVEHAEKLVFAQVFDFVKQSDCITQLVNILRDKDLVQQAIDIINRWDFRHKISLLLDLGIQSNDELNLASCIQQGEAYIKKIALVIPIHLIKMKKELRQSELRMLGSTLNNNESFKIFLEKLDFDSNDFNTYQIFNEYYQKLDQYYKELFSILKELNDQNIPEQVKYQRLLDRARILSMQEEFIKLNNQKYKKLPSLLKDIKNAIAKIFKEVEYEFVKYNNIQERFHVNLTKGVDSAPQQDLFHRLKAEIMDKVGQLKIKYDKMQANKQFASFANRFEAIEASVSTIGDAVASSNNHLTLIPKMAAQVDTIKTMVIENKEILKDLTKQISDYRSVFKSLIKKARDEEEKEDLIEKLIDRVMDAIQLRMSLRPIQADRRIAKENELMEKLGPDVWTKLELDQDAKTMVITAEVIYDSMTHETALDFSPAIIPLTKALERTMKNNFGNPLSRYHKKNSSGKWPDYMLYNGKPIYEDKWTLGNFSSLFSDERALKDLRNTLHIIPPGSILDQALISPTNRKVLINKLKKINKIRNKVAHSDGITVNQAKKCRKIMIEEYKLLQMTLNEFILV